MIMASKCSRMWLEEMGSGEGRREYEYYKQEDEKDGRKWDRQGDGDRATCLPGRLLMYPTHIGMR